MRLHQITLVLMTATIIASGCSSSRTQTRQAAAPFHSRSVTPSNEYDSNPPAQVSSSSASVDLPNTESQKSPAETVAPVPPVQEKVSRVKGVSLSRLLFGTADDDCGTESNSGSSAPNSCSAPSGSRSGIFDCFSRQKAPECAAQTDDRCAPNSAGCVEDSPGWHVPSRLYCPNFAVACVREVRTVGRYFCPPACVQPRGTDACSQECGCNESTNCGDTASGLLPSLFCYKRPKTGSCGGQSCGAGVSPYSNLSPSTGQTPVIQPAEPKTLSPENIPAVPGNVPPIPQGIPSHSAAPSQPMPSGVGAPQTTGDVPSSGTNGGATKQPLTPAPAAEPQSLVVPQAWPKLRTPAVATPVNPGHYYPSSWSLR